MWGKHATIATQHRTVIEAPNYGHILLTTDATTMVGNICLQMTAIHSLLVVTCEVIAAVCQPAINIS